MMEMIKHCVCVCVCVRVCVCVCVGGRGKRKGDYVAIIITSPALIYSTRKLL